MIVQPLGDEVRLIRQHDHAGQCGELAAAWGAAPFRPVPEAVVRAAALHDIGWQSWDAAPAIDPASGLPYRFFEMPLSLHVAIFRRGVALAAQESDLTGLLVSLHAQGLYNGRFGLLPGLGPKPVPPESEGEIVQFFGEQARLQDQLRERLGLSAIDGTLWEHYRLLQLWDGLSLFSLATPPTSRVLPPAPSGAGDVSIAMRPLEPGVVALNPWPFTAPTLETRVPACRIPANRYTAESIREALAIATPETLVVTFVPERE
ncbi:MAG: hypothetical protein KatS3mg060_1403 [Dehalococcoidia bacterium]|nr:MAG: hypothetical protein KatS3mg060_1403 [Dehalococcoidia bacterium]